jgi:uncharacterized damage-inducible protein DinB
LIRPSWKAFIFVGMNSEILLLAQQLNDAYEGQPWFGRNTKELLNEIDESIAFEKPNGQHSILELLWHMITWKEFAISRLQNDSNKTLDYFEKNDWRNLDHSDKTLWQEGVQRFSTLHKEFTAVIGQQKDELLSENVSERNYSFRKLLYGILEHDIYHLGQIAYLKKLLQK